MSHIKRRTFIKSALGAIGGIPALRPSFGQTSGEQRDPHFFLMMHLDGGADSSYLFDARPLAMTQAGLMQNYRGTEAKPWLGANGGQCLTSSLTDPLLPFKDDLAILNGVLMAATFDGHEQNMNQLHTGSAFGGPSFLPNLNVGLSQAPLDVFGKLPDFVNITNRNAVLALGLAECRQLPNMLPAINPASTRGQIYQHLQQRYQHAASSPGRFGAANREILKAFAGGGDLTNRIRLLDFSGIDDSNEPTMESSLKMAFSFFKAGLTNCYSLVLDNDNFDTHDAKSAQNQPQIFANLVADIATAISTLKNTEFRPGKSFLDVTTIMISSEFSRTMRQIDRPIDQTGTDHNALGNSMLLAGKGIHGGVVLGATDFATPDEALSGAHRSMDPERIKIMGRPFDFGTQRPLAVQPDSFDITHYLTSASVINTIFSLYSRTTGVDILTPHRFTLDRRGTVAPVISGLLKA